MSKKHKPSVEEIELFQKAVRKVHPIKSDRILFKKPLPKKIRLQTTELPDFFYKKNDICPVTSDEYLFFSREGVSPKMLRHLRQGKIKIESELDLHGYKSDAAFRKLFSFLQRSQLSGKRCVRIIHGKSRLAIHEPVLKNKINYWLRQMDLVLAFSSAISSHGGVGAVYVLLRAQKEKIL